MINQPFKILTSAILLVVMLSACKTRPAATVLNYPKKTPDALVSLTENSRLEFEFFQAKASVDVRLPQQSNSFGATVRIQRDSAIWVSVSPAMGIEVFRLLCTQDSVFYIDRMKKQYFKGNYKKLSELSGSDLDYAAIQNLLLGDPLYFEKSLDYQVMNDHQGYLLSTKNSHLLEKFARSTPPPTHLISRDSTVTLAERRVLRLHNPDTDEDLVVRQYWLDYTHGKITQTRFTDLWSAVMLNAQYTQFEPVDDQLIPSKIRLSIGNTKDEATFNLDYSRIKLNDPSGMPFSIPEKYDEVRH